MRFFFLVGFAFFLSCGVSPHEETKAAPATIKNSVSAPASSQSASSTQSQPSTQPLFVQPGPILHEVSVAARWKGSIAGAVNLAHPIAIKAKLKDARIPVVLPTHVLVHPAYGMYIVDTGITKKSFYGYMTVVDPLLEILARHQEPLVGCLITHSHFDHLMGLPDVPKEAILYGGPKELGKVSTPHPMKRFDFSKAEKIGELPALDILGDGTLWALWTPGHTAGSTSYLARTTKGPLLFIGDTAHLIWNWESGVGNGKNSANQKKNQESLERLKALVTQYPQIKVYTGHEIDGDGTGVPDGE